MADCPKCGEKDRHVIDGMCDECTGRAFGFEAIEWDPIGACEDHERDLGGAISDIFDGRSRIGDPMECAVVTLIDYCNALYRAIRYRDRLLGAPPKWALDPEHSTERRGEGGS